MIEALDHYGIGVLDYDRALTFFTDIMGLELIREGERTSTGTRIAMIGNEAGSNVKTELIEVTDAADVGLVQIAFRVDDLDSTYESLLDRGFTSISEPHPIEAAGAETAVVQNGEGWHIQLITYGPDSPDMRRPS